VYADVQEIVRKTRNSPIRTPSYDTVVSKLKEASELAEELASALTSEDRRQFAHIIEGMLIRAEDLTISIRGAADKGKKALDAGKAWKARLSKVMLRIPTTITLIEALTPRYNVGSVPMRGRVLQDMDFVLSMELSEYEGLFEVTPQTATHTEELRRGITVRTTRKTPFIN
jgi:hypothetical protein